MTCDKSTKILNKVFPRANFKSKKELTYLKYTKYYSFRKTRFLLNFITEPVRIFVKLLVSIDRYLLRSSLQEIKYKILGNKQTKHVNVPRMDRILPYRLLRTFYYRHFYNFGKLRDPLS